MLGKVNLTPTRKVIHGQGSVRRGVPLVLSDTLALAPAVALVVVVVPREKYVGGGTEGAGEERVRSRARKARVDLGNKCRRHDDVLGRNSRIVLN